MTEILKIILNVLIIILIFIIVLILIQKYYNLKIEGLINIGNPNEVIENQKIKNISIMASYDTAILHGNISSDNIIEVLRTGCRWIDFEVNGTEENPNYPVVSSKLPLKDVLKTIKQNNSQSPLSKSPLFIDLRITGSHDENFYNIIHNTIHYNENNNDGIFTENELYNKPGPIQNVYSDAKRKVLEVLNKYDERFKKKTKNNENFSGMDHLGTENELYENFTYVDKVYKTDANIEGLTINDDTLNKDIEKTKKKILLLRKQKEKLDQDKYKILMKKTPGWKKKIEEIKQQLKVIKKEINELKDNLKKMNKRKIQINYTINKGISDVENEQTKVSLAAEEYLAEYEKKSKYETEPVAGAGRHAQGVINKCRFKNSQLELDNATLINNNRALSTQNADYKSIINKNYAMFGNLNNDVSKSLTNNLRCERCITGDTILKEIQDKIVIVITRNVSTIDGYNNSKLKNIVNIEINDFISSNNDNDKIMLLPYNKLEFSNNSRNNNSTLVTNIDIDVKNEKLALKYSINHQNIQIVKISNLVKRKAYIDMYSNNNSSFILMNDAKKYTNKL